MRQRAALLRTYLFSQNVALLDEPFSALDTLTKSAVHQWYLEVMDQIRLSTCSLPTILTRPFSSLTASISLWMGGRSTRWSSRSPGPGIWTST